MAYGNILASVPEGRILAVQQDPGASLQASYSKTCSHLIAYWIKEQPLGGLLSRILDGGEVLHPTFRHPFRVPLFHRSGQVRELHAALVAEWRQGGESREWEDMEIGRVLDVLSHAASAGEGLISYLEPPDDLARAARVQLPRLNVENRPSE
jgi:hypothetical protein